MSNYYYDFFAAILPDFIPCVLIPLLHVRAIVVYFLNVYLLVLLMLPSFAFYLYPLVNGLFFLGSEHPKLSSV